MLMKLGSVPNPKPDPRHWWKFKVPCPGPKSFCLYLIYLLHDTHRHTCIYHIYIYVNILTSRFKHWILHVTLVGVRTNFPKSHLQNCMQCGMFHMAPSRLTSDLNSFYLFFCVCWTSVTWLLVGSLHLPDRLQKVGKAVAKPLCNCKAKKSAHSCPVVQTRHLLPITPCCKAG